MIVKSPYTLCTYVYHEYVDNWRDDDSQKSRERTREKSSLSSHHHHKSLISYELHNKCIIYIYKYIVRVFIFRVCVFLCKRSLKSGFL